VLLTELIFDASPIKETAERIGISFPNPEVQSAATSPLTRKFYPAAVHEIEHGTATALANLHLTPPNEKTSKS
jgi:hypothetical protein